MNLKKFFVILVALLTLTAYTQTASASSTKDDITGIALEKEMRAMIDAGVISGYGPGLYKPNESVSRIQFAAFIARALDLPASSPSTPFSDVPAGKTLAEHVYSANNAGIVAGYTDNTFRPNANITREQMAAMIDRAIKYSGVALPDAPLNFTDASSISPNFKQAVANNAQSGIIKGSSNGNGTYKFIPKANASRAEAAAFISRMLDLLEKNDGGTTPEVPNPENPTPPSGYKLGYVSGNQIAYDSKSYSSFDEANNALTASKPFITLNGKVVKMKSGIVYAKPSAGNATTLIYDSTLRTQLTYVSKNTEMRYIDADQDKVQVQISDVIGYVKQSEVEMKPLQIVEKRSYYKNVNGELYHYLYSGGSYNYGIAPSFLQPGQEYYSWDGDTFMNSSGTTVGQAHQYFNYLPLRTKTNYSEEELNSYITSILTERQALYTSNPSLYARYKDATTKSKIIGLGTYAKEAEQKYKINALFIISIAMHESDFGMSTYAQTKNNLFGIKAYDSNPDNADSFASPNASVDALANDYLNKNYINPLGAYPNGAITGNKDTGLNVKYASDPYWGQKIAGYMFRVDKFLGKKDINQYKIGISNTAGLNVRSTAEVSSGNLQYTYKKAGMPVVILDNATSGWYKILSDHLTYDEAYVSSQYVDELVIAK
ncbi:S-layer homology domain-containing protein [Ferdinandcohnia quinoae]|uniref:S-layer homology domain-containing protein n=1 Tax=Fredinandcohnia quinoae TaxID=2918902 RepID=A0AAW5E4B1_9BACI|nr:S-layer homology domain-containing protein [Fredinandcohnia sp. SECRCQ15]MCH1627782.1 S-layer homology domain-containing protein [Fredinandcohnia sp. SECRCQ15]